MPANQTLILASNPNVFYRATYLHFQNPINFGSLACTIQAPTGYAYLEGALSGNGGGLTKTGSGTLILDAANSYTGATVVDGGILQLSNSLSLPGGIGATGGTGNLVLNGGLLSLAVNDFLCAFGTGAGQVQFTGPGGFIAYSTGNRTVNLGGAAAQVAWGSGSFVPNGAALTLGSYAGLSTLYFSNPINLGNAVQTINVPSGFAQLNGPLSGSGGLIESGSGTLTLTANCSYLGGTTISGGILQVGTGGASGAIQGNVVDNGTLVFQRSDTFTMPGAISGSGGLTQQGTGMLVLAGANSYSGGTTISAGTLQLGAAGAVPSGSALTMSGGVFDLNGLGTNLGNLNGTGSVTLEAATLTVTTTSYSLFAGTISGAGGLWKSGSGYMALSGNNTFTGGTTISAGTLALAGTYSSNIADNAVLDLPLSASSGTLSNAISGSGAVTIGSNQSSLVQVLTGTNTYTGPTTVVAGILRLGSTLALPGGCGATGGLSNLVINQAR